MKMIITQKKLIEAMEKGALAGLSEEAQSDTSIISTLIKSVKIKADSKNLTVESATKTMATKCVIPIDADIEVKEEGEIVVLAKDVYDYVKVQNNAKIAIALSKFSTPDVVNPLVNENDGSVVKGIKRIGEVKIVTKDESKSGNKTEFDCYESSQLGECDMNIPSDKKFDISLKQLNAGLKAVAFSAMPKHYQHIYDSISFQTLNDKIYMLASDTARASVYELNEVKNGNLDSNMLVPTKPLLSITKLANDDVDISFYVDAKNNKVFLAQGENFIIKLSTTDPSLISKFPPVKMLIGKVYKSLTQLTKGMLLNRLITIGQINDSAALFSFNTKNNKAIITGISSSGKKPRISDLPVTNLSGDFSAVWGVGHILDFIKMLQDEEVDVGIPETGKGSVKFTSKEDKNWSYYVMEQDAKKTKYDQVKAD